MGGVVIRNRAESRRVLSRVLSSTSRNLSLLLGTGSMGMLRVDRRTCDAVLWGGGGGGGMLDLVKEMLYVHACHLHCAASVGQWVSTHHM